MPNPINRHIQDRNSISLTLAGVGGFLLFFGILTQGAAELKQGDLHPNLKMGVLGLILAAAFYEYEKRLPLRYKEHGFTIGMLFGVALFTTALTMSLYPGDIQGRNIMNMWAMAALGFAISQIETVYRPSATPVRATLQDERRQGWAVEQGAQRN